MDVKLTGARVWPGRWAGLGVWQFLVWRTVKASSASFHRNQRNGEKLLVILIGET